MPSIAVLPFADMSPGRDHEYLSDGLAEEILNALAQVEGLHVAGRTSSFSSRAETRICAPLARASAWARCSKAACRKSGNRVRITRRWSRR